MQNYFLLNIINPCFWYATSFGKLDQMFIQRS